MSFADDLDRAAAVLRGARRAFAFTGAGVSVESGIPCFRGPDGLWSRYDPECLDIGSFHRRPAEAWRVIREIFYDHWGEATPNPAHHALARLEAAGVLAEVVTQNIDGLHQAAGSRTVWEYHGGLRDLLCLDCGALHRADAALLRELPPACPGCGGLLKPDFVFFGEAIPMAAAAGAAQAARAADAVLVVGSTAEVYPAAAVVEAAARNGAAVVEVNVEPTRWSGGVAGVTLLGPAGLMLPILADAVLGAGPTPGA
ncbi:MAG TPA: NAD-dependent protein deacylase [Candidatus Krumholzibacteria bacterium]|nr:NAD-dependent protein deacylase [Candidatus Krumholzibacteria bacterium]HRX52384.1 NAD-dependent protein deacylase [Candidatus Krumholzibacteria bacterium]